MGIIETIRQFVEDECKKPTSNYGMEAYDNHFISTVKYAGGLADKLGGDKEVIILAAWLHDIGSIMDGRENHHETGAEIAGKKLAELNYPDDRIELVKKCIRNHRGSRNDVRESIEEKIVAEADALSNFDAIAGIFHVAYVTEGLNESDGREAAVRKLRNKYNKLHFDESRKLVQAKYDAAMLLFGQDKRK
jgi:uncharacterized protein